MRIALLFILLLLNEISLAQDADANWDSYIAMYENELPGSTTLNMDLHDRAPVAGLPNVVVTGLTYTNDRPDGLPVEGTLDTLYTLQEQLLSLMKTFGKYEHVGSFTHAGERLEYFYLADSTGVFDALYTFYTQSYPNLERYINVKLDADWSYYREFLYPNEPTLAYMADLSVIRRLQEAGDPLTQPRRVDHWLHFTNSTDMKNCSKELKKLGFKVEKMMEDGSGEWTHSLQIWGINQVDIGTSIHSIPS